MRWVHDERIVSFNLDEDTLGCKKEDLPDFVQGSIHIRRQI